MRYAMPTAVFSTILALSQNAVLLLCMMLCPVYFYTATDKNRNNDSVSFELNWVSSPAKGGTRNLLL